MTSVKIIKNELRCRDDTVPKTVGMVEGMQQSSATPKNRDVGRGLRKIVACPQPYLAVASCIYSFWHGVIPISYFDFYTCFTHFSLTVAYPQHRGLPSLALRMGGVDLYPDIRISLARTLFCSCARYIKIRMREIQLVIEKWRRILRKLPDLSKSPSERYKLSVCIKGACTTCIEAALYNFYGL